MDPKERQMLIEKHQMLIEAHQTVLQSLKYPEMVSPGAVARAKVLIRSHGMLDWMANKPREKA